ncbi:MAG: glycosyltransferase [Candidatus Liptonbacteria bacterium]|nr:glycosyltransferase [Candidatus Liptonbacteria bacterium]
MPIATIILPVKDQEKLIGRSIQSVIDQTFRDWELIVVNDGSTDRTADTIKGFAGKDARVVYLDNGKNLGIPKTFNRAAKIARGKYIGRLDSDDAWIGNDKLKKQVEFLDAHPDYVATGGGMVVVDEGGKELYRYLKPERDEDIRKSALVTSPISSSTFLGRADAVLRAGPFDETLNFNEDWDFFLKLGTFGKMYNFPEYFSYYTMTGRNRSAVFMRTHTIKGFEVLFRYRKQYPRFWQSFFMHCAQFLYSLIPFSLRESLHPALSRLKKVFARI